MSASYQTILSHQDITNICNLYAHDKHVSMGFLAKQYNLSVPTIKKVLIDHGIVLKTIEFVRQSIYRKNEANMKTIIADFYKNDFLSINRKKEKALAYFKNLESTTT